jgi:hypothetical protein
VVIGWDADEASIRAMILVLHPVQAVEPLVFPATGPEGRLTDFTIIANQFPSFCDFRDDVAKNTRLLRGHDGAWPGKESVSWYGFRGRGSAPALHTVFFSQNRRPVRRFGQGNRASARRSARSTKVARAT